MRRLILTLVLVAAAIVGGYVLLNRGEPEELKVPVLVATGDIASGRFIPVESIEVRQVTPAEQTEFTKKNGLLVPAASHKDLQNYVPRRPMKKGDVVAEKNLIRPSDPDFLPAVLKQGLRAVSIRLNDVASGFGLYRPGNYVDVILTYSEGSQRTAQKRVAVTLFRGLRILALGGDLGLTKAPADAKADKKVISVVTLEASPRQAEEIVLASKLGDLSLSLRATEGNDAVSEPTITYATDLMQRGESEAVGKQGNDRVSSEPIKIRGLYGDQQKTITLEK